jgi:hypothetical protein
MADTIFLDGTIYPKTRLNLINRCLLAIGETPYPEGTVISSLALGTDGETASRIVAETMIEVQSIGWYFNLDYDYKLYKDVDNFIAVPPNTLRVDTLDSNQYIEKNGRIYDMNTQSYIITPIYVEADVVWLVDYPTLPAEAYEYIAARAARKFQQYIIGAPDLTQTTSAAENDAYVRLQRRQLQTRAYNIQNARVSTRMSNAHLRPGMRQVKDRR